MPETETVTDIETALTELGVTDQTLTETEKIALDEKGFVIIRNLIDRQWLEELRAAFEHFAQDERATQGYNAKQEQGTRHLSLFGKAKALDKIYTHPKLLACAYRVIKRDFRMYGVGGRDPLPGFGKQGLHADWHRVAHLTGEFDVVNSIWMLDDFTNDNGATRLVPGTHKYHDLTKKQSVPDYNHPQQILATAPAGSVLIFNGHTLHSGTLNQSQKGRRGINAFYVATEYRTYLPAFETAPAEFERFSSAEKYIMGI